MKKLLLVWFRTAFLSFLAGMVSFILLWVLLQDIISETESLLFIISLFLNGLFSGGYAAYLTGLAIYQKKQFGEKSIRYLLEKFLPVITLPLLATTVIIGISGGFAYPEAILITLNTFLLGYASLAIYIFTYQHTFLTEQ